MNRKEVESLKVGDEVGIVPAYGRSRFTEYAIVPVIKVTKITITVQRNNRTQVFNISNGYERGSKSKYYTDYLCSAERARENNSKVSSELAIAKQLEEFKKLVERPQDIPIDVLNKVMDILKSEVKQS